MFSARAPRFPVVFPEPGVVWKFEKSKLGFPPGLLGNLGIGSWRNKYAALVLNVLDYFPGSPA